MFKEGGQRKLSYREVLIFFLILTVVYVFPIIHADYLYIDDQWRALLLVGDGWRDQGRILVEVLYKVLTFTPSMPNIFPLPILLSALAISMIMTGLVFYYYPEPTYSSCLVVLPLWCNPFFLGNLTYQYDGPAMVLGVVAVVYAIIAKFRNRFLEIFISGLCVAIALAFYQVLVSLFIGLCCVDAVWRINKRESMGDVWRSVFRRMLQLVLGVGMYGVGVYKFIKTDRGKLLAFDSNWSEIVGERLLLAERKIELLNVPGVTWMLVMFLFFSSVGWLIVVRDGLKNEKYVLGKLGVLTLCVCVIPVLFLCVPGVMTFIAEDRMDARNLIGFSAVLVLLFYMSHEFLGRFYLGLAVIFVVPYLYMYSLSYSYGQVLVAKKELEISIAQNISFDLMSRDELKEVERFCFFAGDYNNWLPATQGAMTLMPILKYVLSSDNVILFPDRFPRLGITNVVSGHLCDDREGALRKMEGKVVVNNKFYTISLVGSKGVILVKGRVGSDEYNP